MLRKYCAAVACVVALLSANSAYSFPVNYLSGKLGASVSTQAELLGKGKPNDLLSNGPVSDGGFVFANGQDQVFTVDLGKARLFNRMDFGSGNAGGDRSPEYLKISVSNKGPQGPFKTIFTKKDIALFQV
ncbi:MAG: hypothetical protein Q7N50_10925, partial [Armatimonadota bacterium]|nr:hypothetical protein [Armatimonadota bacterium]